MNQRLQKAIDREIRKERSRRRRKWLVVAVGVIAILVVYTPLFSERLVGKTLGFSAGDVANVTKIQMRVRLASGKEVSILVDKDLDHAVGETVEVSRMTSLAGMASYQFIGYVQPGA